MTSSSTHRTSRRDLLETASLLGLWGLLPSAALARQERRTVSRSDRERGRDTPADADALWRRGALQLAEDIRERRITSLEVVEAHVQRIREVNPSVNAITTLLERSALETARKADTELRSGRDVGPLHGVPFTVKSDIDLTGSPTTQGVRALADNYPERDAPVTERMKAAGAIPIARTNLPDFGMRTHTDSQLHGATLNPWDRGRTPGGSSGGEGAAIATGMSPLGLGSDIGGSLRIPAHANGIASLKPTLGRIPQAAVVPGGPPLATQLMAVEGPMARHVADLEAAYRVLAGYHVADPWSVPVPLDVARPERGIRVALVPEPSGGPTARAVAAGVELAGDVLRRAGYRVELVEPPELPEVARVWGQFLATDIKSSVPGMSSMMSEGSRKFLNEAIAVLGQVDVTGFSQLLAQRHSLAAAWEQFQSRFPLIVGPVSTEQPFDVGYDLRGRAEVADVLRRIRFTVAGNLLGLPAVVVPVGTDSRGMPMSAQIVGGRFREQLCLEAAAALEERLTVLTPIDPRR